MKEKLIITLLLITSYCFCQTRLRAKVTDTNNVPIAFANIYIANSNKGTITNENGEFYLVANLVDKTLIISHLGFQELKIPISENFPKKIVLKKSAIELDEIVLSNKINPKEIADKVIDNLYQNHKAYSPYFDYFRRVVVYTENRETGLIEEYFGQLQHQGNTKINIIKSRSLSFNKEGKTMQDKLQMHGFYKIESDNMLKYVPAFLTKRHIKKYEILLEGYTTINETECYILKYSYPKGNYSDDIKATLYIDKETYGIVKMFTRGYNSKSDNYLERNFTKIDNYWALSSTIEKHKNTFSVTVYNALPSGVKIEPRLKKISSYLTNPLINYNNNLDDSFWENYQHIPLPDTD